MKTKQQKLSRKKETPDEKDEAASSAPETSPPESAMNPRAATRAPVATPGRANVWRRAAIRWVAITAVISALLALYMLHPYYKNQQFAPFRALFPTAFGVWGALGIFYCKATLEKFDAMRFTMRDSGLHLVMLGKAFQEGRFWRLAKNRRVRTTLLAIVVKAFYIPLMVGFFVHHMEAISRAWLRMKHLPALDFKLPVGETPITIASLWWKNVGVRLADFVPSLHDIAVALQPWTWSRGDFSWGLGFAYDIIFAIDCGWAVIGYSSESRWLGNKTKSVEPTAFGWLVTLAWYPPFNNITGTYLPLANGPQWITNDNVLLGFRALTVFLFAIYAAATVSFGLRFSNLTNRGIISRGPYRFVRHPAYLCKCTAWWLEHLPTMTLHKALFLSITCFVYGLRAWTEERHLGMDPEYQAYKKKTPWVFIPGVW